MTMPAALFISDLHLQSSHPRTSAAFLSFLEHHAQYAQALYLLGDLFEYWAGDDDLEDPFNARMTAAIRAVSDAGVHVYWIAGNRDFLVGSGFAAAAGATLLSEPHVATPNARKMSATWSFAPWCASLPGKNSSCPCRWRSARPSSMVCAKAAARTMAKNPWISWMSPPMLSRKCLPNRRAP